MKKLLLLCLLFLPLKLEAATCFWVGGTGNFNDTTHWSSSSGGAGSTCAGAGGVPYTGSDSATLDASSCGAACTVTMNVSANTTGALTFGACTNGCTLADAGNNQTWGSVSGTGTGTRTVNFTAAQWTITGSVAVWTFTTVTNLTNTSMPTLININNTGAVTIGPGALTYNDFSFTGSGATVTWGSQNATFRDLTVSIGAGSYKPANASATVRNLSITADTCPTNTGTLLISGNVTISAATSCAIGGSITLNGSSGTQVVTTNGMTGNTSNWTVNNSGTGVVFDTLTTTGTFSNTAGTTTFSGALSAGGTVGLTAGTLTFNGPVTMTTFSSSNANIRSVAFNRGPVTLSGTSTIFTNATSTNFTMTCAPGVYFVFSDSSTTSKTITLNGANVGCLKYYYGAATHGWTVTP